MKYLLLIIGLAFGLGSFQVRSAENNNGEADEMICYSTQQYGECSASYKTYCEGQLMCSTRVWYPCDGNNLTEPCIAGRYGDGCRDYGHNLPFPKCGYDPLLTPHPWD